MEMRCKSSCVQRVSTCAPENHCNCSEVCLSGSWWAGVFQIWGKQIFYKIEVHGNKYYLNIASVCQRGKPCRTAHSLNMNTFRLKNTGLTTGVSRSLLSLGFDGIVLFPTDDSVNSSAAWGHSRPTCRFPAPPTLVLVRTDAEAHGPPGFPGVMGFWDFCRCVCVCFVWQHPWCCCKIDWPFSLLKRPLLLLTILTCGTRHWIKLEMSRLRL